MEDCPDCGRLQEIEDRLKAGVLHTEDTKWMIAQIRNYQQWAVKVIDLIDPIHALHVAYDGLFKPVKKEVNGQLNDRPGDTGHQT